MGLHYSYEFTAPAGTDSRTLAAFLDSVLVDAAKMGFDPALVLDVPFDSAARRDFARRIGGGLWVQDSRLKTGVPRDDHVIRHDPREGDCRVAPSRGVVLVVTDERGAEACFGFMQFPERVENSAGNTLAETRLLGRWAFADYVSSADPRYRQIVERFRRAGYLEKVNDDYVSSAS